MWGPQEGAAEAIGIYFWRCGGSVSLVIHPLAPRGKPEPQLTNCLAWVRPRGSSIRVGGSPMPNPACIGQTLLPMLAPALSGGSDPQETLALSVHSSSLRGPGWRGEHACGFAVCGKERAFNQVPPCRSLSRRGRDGAANEGRGS